jgi:fructosamine-3-kinase
MIRRPPRSTQLRHSFPTRRSSDLYNLYHVLNHFNLFGGGYADQAEAMAGRLLAERG